MSTHPRAIEPLADVDVALEKSGGQVARDEGHLRAVHGREEEGVLAAAVDHRQGTTNRAQPLDQRRQVGQLFAQLFRIAHQAHQHPVDMINVFCLVWGLEIGIALLLLLRGFRMLAGPYAQILCLKNEFNNWCLFKGRPYARGVKMKSF